jgi:membrane protein DedA with SNARE-associated domain
MVPLGTYFICFFLRYAASNLQVGMTDFGSMIARHGHLAVFAIVLMEAIGLPVPAAIALVAAGAAVAKGLLPLHTAFLAALGAMFFGDSLLYLLGRFTGWQLLGILCRLSANPESCILRSADSFYKRGKATLLIAKFIPGINTMAPPLAGSMNMGYLQFVRFDLAGAALYTLAYGTVGYAFSNFLGVITKGFMTVGHGVEWIIAAAIVVYIGYRVWLFWKHRVYRVVPRVQAEELAKKLESSAQNVLIVDVRSHGYYDADTFRIKGSVRLEPNRLSASFDDLPKDKQIFLYCT